MRHPFLLRCDRPRTARGGVGPNARLRFAKGSAALAGGALAAGFLAAPAAAQVGFLQGDTTLVKPSIPEGFDRGRNVSVVDKERPDYAPLGIIASSFKIYPRIDVGIGATSNVFLSADNERSKGYVYATPLVRVASDWSRHSLALSAGTELQRYFDNPRRNQTAFNVQGNGELEFGEDFTLNGEAQLTRQYESPETGDVQSNIAVLSSYLRSYGGVRLRYQAGRARAQIAVDATHLEFATLDLGNGTAIDQSNRDRDLGRINGQVDYALTPSVSLYGQIGYDRIVYDTALSSVLPNRDSRGFRAIGGINFDIAGFVRGSVGLGYIRRDYDRGMYRDVDGVSAEASIEYFPTELTTVTLRLRRFLEDSSFFSNIPYFDNRVGLRVDHELLRNLLLNAQAEYSNISYVGLSQDRKFYRVSGGATYMLSRNISLKTTVTYGKQTPKVSALGVGFEEVRGQVGISFQL